MPSMPHIPGGWRVRVLWETGNTIWRGSMVLFFRSLAGYQEPEALAARLNARFSVELLRGMVVGTVCQGYRMFDLEQPTATRVLPGNWVPTIVVAGRWHPSLAIAIQARPASRLGPLSTFRFPFLREGIGQNGTITEVQRLALETAWRNFRTNMLADGWEWGRPTGDAGAWLPFSQVKVRRSFATMRVRQAAIDAGPRT